MTVLNAGIECSKNHVYDSAVPYALSHALCATPGYSSKRADAPACMSAFAIMRLFSKRGAVSWSPQNDQIGTPLILVADVESL